MRRQKGTTTKKFEFKGFKNLSFTQTEIDQIILLQETDEAGIDDCITVMVEAGYKVSFGFDDYSGSLTGALTCKEPGSMYCGWVFTLRNVSAVRLCYAFRWYVDTYLRDELVSVGDDTNLYDW